MKIYFESIGTDDANMVVDMCCDLEGVTVDKWDALSGYTVAINTPVFMMNNIGNNVFFVVGSVTCTVSFTLNYLSYESIKIV